MLQPLHTSGKALQITHVLHFWTYSAYMDADYSKEAGLWTSAEL